jgi:hypothetical protein
MTEGYYHCMFCGDRIAFGEIHFCEGKPAIIRFDVIKLFKKIKKWLLKR